MIGSDRITQDKKWLARYNEVVAFIETNKRNPLKHRIEEHDNLNWIEKQGERFLFYIK